jgi:hypothetical protein
VQRADAHVAIFDQLVLSSLAHMAMSGHRERKSNLMVIKKIIGIHGALVARLEGARPATRMSQHRNSKMGIGATGYNAIAPLIALEFG